mmetsp:Transcript_34515/g.102532  ORF Transcript_34515/g.102532 Transcript_34515/m.102532 type:complete len:342 (-) Transcript_34515:735-1760(-)
MQLRRQPSTASRVGASARGRPRPVAARGVSTVAPVVVKEAGAVSLRGTVRKQNEDTYEIKDMTPAGPGALMSFAGVYDGHGGDAVAQWLPGKLLTNMSKAWRGGAMVAQAITDAYLMTDKKLLATKNGFMGLGERGVGGAKCGATAATVALYQDTATGSTKLVAANIGDARTLLVSSTGKTLQLSFDHVPDQEVERKRIERFNPNPKQPLVRYVGGTWRTGGLLALSRAFGDAYMKGSLQFEGITEGSDGYSSGFGVIAEPYVQEAELSAEDAWVVVSSDGLYAEVERGGGGGLTNEQVGEILAAAPGASAEQAAKELAAAAQEVGSTDDVTVVVLRLGSK